MKKILHIFDRLKEAFKVNVQNKKIYKQQILLAVINTIATLVFLGMIYSLFLRLRSSGYNFGIFTFSDLISGIVATILIVITLGLIQVFFEAGLFQMYYKAVYSGETNNNDFFEGTKKYFWKFFGVNIIKLLMWVFLIPIYLILGIITLGAGFILIPIVIEIFLAMWKVSLVVDECGIISAFTRSVKFAGKNFVPFMLFIFLMLAFTAPVKQNNGINVASDIQKVIKNFEEKANQNRNQIQPDKDMINPNEDVINPLELNTQSQINFDKDISDIFNENKINEGIQTPSLDLQQPDYKPLDDGVTSKISQFFGKNFHDNLIDVLNKASGIINIVLVALISLMTVGTFISSLVKMILMVFFMLAMFVIYKEGFIEKTSESEEVLQA